MRAGFTLDTHDLAALLITLAAGVNGAEHLHLLTHHVPIFVLFSGLVSALLAAFSNSGSAPRVAIGLLIRGAVGG